MKLPQARSFWMAALAVLFVAVLLPATALAQDGESSGPTRVAVLNVPGGGTDALLEKLGQIPNLELLEQNWFIKQIQNRGFEAKGIMRRPKDLKWVMDGGQLDYVLFLAPVSEQAYEARIVVDDGTVAKRISVDRTSDGLSEAGAELVRRQFGDFLDANNARVQKLGGPDEGDAQQADSGGDDEEMDPNELKRRAATEKDAKVKALSKDWLYAKAGLRMTKRGFSVVAQNEETVSYRSGYYPAIEIDLEAYPFGMSNADLQAVGFYTGFRYGQDSFQYQFNDADETVLEPSIPHPEFTFGVAIRGENPAKDMDSEADPRTRLTVGIRYVNFPVQYGQLPEGQAAPLPSLAHFDVTIGGRLAYPVAVDGLFLSMKAELAPLSFLPTDPNPFGSSTTAYGFAGEMGLLYMFTDSIGLGASYGGRLTRANFEGRGLGDFDDPSRNASANLFELVQGFSANLQYHY